MLIHPAPISIYYIAELVGKSFPKAFSISNIQKRFQVGGIYSINEKILADDEFLSSHVTDRVKINSTNADNTVHTITSEGDQEPPTSATKATSEKAQEQPSTSTTQAFSEGAKEPAAEMQVINTNIPSCSITDPTVTLEMIRPFPKAGLRKKETGGRQGENPVFSQMHPKKSK
ncbi:hypothetical protein JTB14_004569 [Gonioctena quinquepunctata]|nr:hypothetical protein JTB14_004569 [Gonioctena quinquepunctata]